MWKKESKWINTRMEKVINHNLYFKDARLLTTKEMLGYNSVDNIETPDPIIEEMMEAITSAPSLIL